MKQIKFNEETGSVTIQTETGFEILNRLHQNTEYTDYTNPLPDRVNDALRTNLPPEVQQRGGGARLAF